MGISAVSSTAVLILQQPGLSAATGAQRKTDAPDLVAIANGARIGAANAAPAQAQSDEMAQITERKAQLYQKVGEELGVKMEDYPSMSAYAGALREVITKAQTLHPEAWPQTKADIEHKLGLDKLGISLDTLVASIDGSDTDANDALTKALEREMGHVGASGAAAHAADDAGLYTPSTALAKTRAG